MTTRISARMTNQRGVSMIDLVTSVMVFAVLGLMGQPVFSELMEAFELQGATRQVFAEVQRARMAAVMENTSCQVALGEDGALTFKRFDLETNAWEAMADQNLSAEDTENLTVSASNTITFVANGATSSSGTITLTDAGGESRSISVGPSGNVRVY